MRVARQHFETTLAKQDQPHLMTVHYSFLNRTEIGPALFEVEDVKLGRQTSVVHVTLSQGGRKEVVAYMTHTNFDKEPGPTYDTKWKMTPPPPPIDWKLIAKKEDPNWAHLEHIAFKNFRKATARVDMVFPRHGWQETACFDQWMCFNTTTEDGRQDRFTNVSLGFVADTFPQVVEAQITPEQYMPPGRAEVEATVKREQQRKKAAAHWYPTVLLNLEVKKALPSEGIPWIYQRCRVKLIQNGRFDIETIVLDADGDVVAISNHVALIFPATRNTAAREKADVKL